jgi:ATP-dependent Clp protease adaptor protein ClpS
MSLEKILPDAGNDVAEKASPKCTLILHNDDKNLFEHVMESLIDVCGHTSEQAEQCTLIAHFKGKCDVKHGDYTSLEAMHDALSLRGIITTIEA